MDQKHLHFTLRDLRRAYKDAGALPAAGTWREDIEDEKGLTVYRCPLNLTCGAFSSEAAAFAWAAEENCVNSFTSGWDTEAARGRARVAAATRVAGGCVPPSIRGSLTPPLRV